MEDKNNLFHEFPEVSGKEWKEKLKVDLKGKSFNDLIQSSEDGIDIKPFYTSEDIDPLNIPTERLTESWQIRQDFTAENPKSTNQSILKALENGTEAVGLRFTEEQEIQNLPQLLDGVNPEFISVHFVADELCERVLEAFKIWTEEKGCSLNKLSGSFNYDPFCKNKNQDFKAIEAYIEKAKSALPTFKTLTIHAQGTTARGELNYLFNRLRQYKQLSTINHQLQFSIPISPNYFSEISKLRALRWLWRDWQLKQGSETPVPAFIQAQKSWKLNDDNDPYHNILMHTTEAMSAIIGGCDVLSLLSTDKTDEFDNDFFERVSRNIQLILKHEAHFDKVTDPAKGSYYVEALTRYFAEEVGLD